jgi:alpha-glucosidase
MRRWMRRIAGAIAALALLAALVMAGVMAWPAVRDSLWLAATPHGVLHVAPGLAGVRHELGAFAAVLAQTERGVELRITHRDEPGAVKWRSVPGRAFVAAAAGQTTMHEARGMIHVDDHVDERCEDQHVDAVARTGDGIELRGRVICAGREVGYGFALRPVSERALAFAITLADAHANRVYLIEASSAGESYFGFGAQFTHFDLKGRLLPIVVSEQGIGRGLQPLTLGANLTADGAGGEWHHSYAGVPHYVTSDQRSLHLGTYDYAVFDMRRDDATIIELHAAAMHGHIFAGATPLALIEAYTEIAGRMRPLPAWITRGAILGIQGGPDAVRTRLARFEEQGAPVAAVWLQDWVGQRTTSFGKQLWWSWSVDRAHYPDWDALVAELAARDVRVLTYVNPFMVDAGERGPGYPNHFAEARARGFLVRAADGNPYMIRNTSFSAGLLDLSSPAARQWIKDLIRRELIGSGASGWMADFGEGFPPDGVISGGVPGQQLHNMYPELWAQVNREVIEEAGLGETATFFMRSGYTRSPRHATLFWLGDQLVSWDHHDGIKTAVTGMLSSGISGFAFQHSDVGGYTTLSHPLLAHHRSRELLMRWAELGAWNVVFRTHEGNRPADNHQFFSDPETLAHVGRMARLHACWEPYRRRLIEEAARRGWPVARHPYLHHPGDPVLRRLDHQQLMIGADLMVAPVLDPDQREVELYLPAGSGVWVDLWTEAQREPGWHVVDAPLGRPAVMFRSGSAAGAEIRDCLRAHGLL